jgi:rod shape-determining protein MreD
MTAGRRSQNAAAKIDPMRRYDPRWLIVFAANLLLWWLTGMLNDRLAGVAVHVYAGGLFVAYAALRLDRRHGLAAIVLTGLVLDAAAPVPFGTSVVLFGLIHATLLYGRQQLPREGAVFGVVVALLANLFLFIALSFLLVGANPRPAGAWLRIFADLLASQGFILLVAPWFLALQDRAMALVQIHPETGRHVVL